MEFYNIETREIVRVGEILGLKEQKVNSLDHIKDLNVL